MLRSSSRWSLVLLVSAGVAAGACDRPPPLAEVDAPQRQSRAGAAFALEEEVARLAARNAGGDDLWPGFEPLAIPLAVYDGEQTFLFRHPAPPPELTPVGDAEPGAWVRDGRHEAVVANTSVEIGGVATATILLDRSPPDRPLADVAAMAIHEAFHVYQRAKHPDWIANEADLFTYPTDSGELLALRRLETGALAEALAAEDVAEAACWTRLALTLRGDRYARMDPAFAAYERGTELNEGLATYVELRAAGRRAVELPSAGFGPTEVRRRAYATGAALALLLGRFEPEWRDTFGAADEPLDAALAGAVGPGRSCAYGDDVVAAARNRAERDVAALQAEREERVSRFEAMPGWRVVVEAEDLLLWPQGFDPLNVEPMDARRILHTRLLRLGNDAGTLEVLNATAMTEGAGSHPLFQGVRRVTLTGLQEPRLTEAEGGLTVVAPGLTLEFQGATFARSDETITVRLGR